MLLLLWLLALCWCARSSSVSVASLPEPTPGSRTFYPTAFPRPDALPTREITAVSQDLQGVVQRREGSRRLDLRLDANLLFARDSDVLLPQASTRLRGIGRELRARPPARVSITGYTDDLGSSEHGLDLSRRRAARVQAALADSLARHRVTVSGRGEEQPVVPNDSEANRARNRRVEIRVSGGVP
ncbi:MULTISPECIES: OmpA family protein [unclassified Luteococcus]|uniref:OmpA family protein n=1 Tax=unclassified Luteococcus TaxID=2639923 RepID=UPI00313A9A82